MTDEDVFTLRERERQEKARQRELNMTTKIWDKTKDDGTAIRVSQIRAARAKKHSQASQVTAAHSFQGRRKDKENMAVFIAKKREMFLMQMSLDTKKKEIQKLEDKAKQKEEALRNAERMLEEDAMRFDAFLKENDRRAHQALKAAERETKEKQEKTAELKRLKAIAETLDNEIQRAEDQLMNCEKYKRFLDSLTPPAELEAAQKAQAEAAQRRAGRELSRRLAQGEKPETDGALPNLSSLTVSGVDADGVESDDDDEDSEDDEAQYMHFRDPQQLLSLFAQLEERNLFLIQNVQETEETLEELNRKYQQLKDELTEKTSQLQQNIADLGAKIAAERAKTEALKQRAHAGSQAGNQHKLLQSLTVKIREVYTKFCSGEQPDPVDMLRALESELDRRLNEILTYAAISKEKALEVKHAEEHCNDERSKASHQEKLAAIQQDEREHAALTNARTNAEITKFVGKPLMRRSKPPFRKHKEEKSQVVEVDLEEKYLFSPDY